MSDTTLTAEDIQMIRDAFNHWDAKVDRDAYNTPHIVVEGWQLDVNEYQAAAFRKLLGDNGE